MRHIKKLFGSTKTKELHSVSMSIDEYLKLNTPTYRKYSISK